MPGGYSQAITSLLLTDALSVTIPYYVNPDTSYRRLLNKYDDLLLISGDDAVEFRYDNNPMSSFGPRYISVFIGNLPMESPLQTSKYRPVT